MLLKITICLSVLFFINAERVRYDNYSLYRIRPLKYEHLEYLTVLNNGDGIHFWKIPISVGDYGSVIVSPENKDDFVKALREQKIFFESTQDNIQQAFDDQNVSRKRRDAGMMYWDSYQGLGDIYNWFQYLAETYSDLVTVVHAGQSYEGRNITGVKISRGTSNRTFFIAGGQIGADWLSPAVVTYIVDQLVRGDDPEAKTAAEDFEWHIFPILNPDGHEYSDNSERLWIKNRAPTSEAGAVGVDLSKNWNSHWGIIGGSFSKSASNFVGLGPFSEPETRATSAYIESIGSQLVALLSFGGFGQRLIIPFAHTTQPLYNYDEMMTIGRRAMGSMSVRYGTRYHVGTSSAVHDGSTGSIADWVKFRFNPPVVASYLLRDEGVWGYTLPVNQVKPTCEETFDSVMAIIREAKFINVL